MLNREKLFALAEEAGFSVTVAKERERPLNNFKSDQALRDATYSICVFAPPFDEGDRYLPFNNKCDGAGKIIEQHTAAARSAARMLDGDGLMFIYGLPRALMRYAAALSGELVFRYWIAISAATEHRQGRLRPEHTGLLVMSKPAASINRIRVAHRECRACALPLKDWGGKSHLMHPEGVALSDVWTDIVVDSHSRMPSEVFERILRISQSQNRSRLLLLAPDGEPLIQETLFEQRDKFISFDPFRLKPSRHKGARAIPDEMLDKLNTGQCLETLKRIPSETVDLAFADPPFNLTKKYNGYTDDRAESDYIGWCKRWLIEYERVLKPGGSMFILNLPKWAALLGDFLSRRDKLYVQSWIVWNSLAEPKGVLMPAHYALLYVTKGEKPSRFNYCSMENGWQPFDEAVFPPDRADVCRRRSCVRKRRASASAWRGELTDIWHDIPRVRQPAKNRSSKKAHPCETPERLVDRIIRLATNAGDVVLDAFAGTGTTAMVARRLDRRFIAIEQDDDYVEAACRRVSEPRSLRGKIRGARRGRASKRALQLELKRLATLLGRLPAETDVEMLSVYDVKLFEGAFRSWAEALKAARIVEKSLLELPAMSRFAERGPLDRQKSAVENTFEDVTASPDRVIS